MFIGSSGIKSTIPPPPPPRPPLSVTKRAIAEFWRRKRVEQEDHFLAAIKAAARIRARHLTEEDYHVFEESLNRDGGSISIDQKQSDQVRIGIKDWWTKSKHAYLNQPAVRESSTDDVCKVKRSSSSSSTYTPYFFHYKPTTPLYPSPTSLAV